MKIAVINEVSARDKNPYILSAIKKCGIDVVNAGMIDTDSAENGLTYIHNGLMAGILLNLGAVDFVVGGCGTGQGFLLSAMQYPDVFCGLIDNPLDAWLYSQINGGNCISLALNKGFGWAGDKNLENIFEKLFEDEFGRGYPKERSESQRLSRMALKNISISVHKPMEEILNNMDKSILNTVFAHAPFVELIKGNCKNTALQNNILNNYYRGMI